MCQCVSFRCPAPNRSVREFPDLVHGSQGQSKLDLLSPLRTTPLLQRSMLSSSEASIQISQCGFTDLSHSPVAPFFETGSPAKVLSTKTASLSTCFWPPWASSPDIALHVSTGQSRIREAHSFSGPNVRCFSKIQYVGPSMKVSCKQICILLLHLSAEADSVFRLTQVCLAVSLVVCSVLQCSYYIPIH